MTVFKYFLKTALRQKFIIVGYTAIFFLLSIIKTANTDTKEMAFMEQNLNIGIVDQSNSELSKELINYLDQHNMLINMENNMDEIKEQIFLEVVEAVILIPEDFESKVVNKEKGIEMVRDERKMGPLQIENQINKFLAFSNATYKEGAFHLEKVKEALKQQAEVELLETGNSSENNWASNWFGNYFNFAGYIIIAIYIAVIGLIMSAFNSKDIQDRMKISAKKALNIHAEIYLGQVVLGILVTTVFVMGCIVLKGNQLSEVNFIKYIANAYVFSFSILCFTFLINNITTSRFAITGISTVASLGTAFISGVFVPQEFLGEKVLAVAKFFPTYYYIKINDMRITSFFDIWYEVGMQILFGIVFLALGLYFSKIKERA